MKTQDASALRRLTSQDLGLEIEDYVEFEMSYINDKVDTSRIYSSMDETGSTSGTSVDWNSTDESENQASVVFPSNVPSFHSQKKMSVSHEKYSTPCKSKDQDDKNVKVEDVVHNKTEVPTSSDSGRVFTRSQAKALKPPFDPSLETVEVSPKEKAKPKETKPTTRKPKANQNKLSPEEKAKLKAVKLEAKRQRNRELAAESRERKRKRMEFLENENRELRQKVMELEKKLQTNIKGDNMIRWNSMGETLIKREISNFSITKELENLDPLFMGEDDPSSTGTYSKAGVAALLTTGMVMIADAGTKTTSARTGTIMISIWAAAWDFINEVGFFNNAVNHNFIPLLLSLMLGLILCISIVCLYYVRTHEHSDKSLQASILLPSLSTRKIRNRKGTKQQTSTLTISAGNKPIMQRRPNPIVLKKSNAEIVLF